MKANWGFLRKTLRTFPPIKLSQAMVNWRTRRSLGSNSQTLVKSFEKSCPLPIVREDNPQPPWWTKDIWEQMKKTGKLGNATINPHLTENKFQVAEIPTYTYIAPKKTLRRNWFYTTTEAARLRKVISKPTYLRPDNFYTESGEEVLEILIWRHISQQLKL